MPILFFPLHQETSLDTVLDRHLSLKLDEGWDGMGWDGMRDDEGNLFPKSM